MAVSLHDFFFIFCVHRLVTLHVYTEVNCIYVFSSRQESITTYHRTLSSLITPTNLSGQDYAWPSRSFILQCSMIHLFDIHFFKGSIGFNAAHG